MLPGEKKAWEVLEKQRPADVCRRALTTFDETTGLYTMSSFGRSFSISVRDKKIESQSPDGDVLLKKLGYFFSPSVLWYLTAAKDIPLTGQLVKPMNLKGGHLFFRGSHVLPVDRVAVQFANDKDGFLRKGFDLGGEQAEHGDASLRVFPFPKIPVTLILWLRDDEFPPRVDLLFDSTCESHLPLDVIWSIAMMSLLVFLQ